VENTEKEYELISDSKRGNWLLETKKEFNILFRKNMVVLHPEKEELTSAINAELLRSYGIYSNPENLREDNNSHLIHNICKRQCSRNCVN